MLKKNTSLALLLVCGMAAQAQTQYPGYRSGNYTGVNGVFFNPAHIADSRYRWDVNLFGINAGIGNNNASFSLKNIGETFSSDVEDKLLGGGNKSLKALGNVDILGPSFMFNTGKKMSFAITTRMRTLVNINDMDGQLMQSIKDQADDATFPYSVASDKNQSLSLTGWTDFGLSLGRVLADKGKHFFKGGLTVKYLAGIGNSYVNINKLNGTIAEDGMGDAYLTGTTGSLAVGVGGLNIDDIDGGNAFKFNGSGVGADLGFVYEFRPDEGKASNRYQNKYKYRVGLSLLDLGSIRFKADPDYTAAYNVNIGAGQQFYLDELNDKSVSEIKTYLDASPYFTSQGDQDGKYKVSLPTTIQASFDWNLNRGFFVDIAAQLALHSKDKFKNPFYQNTVTLTPRYEGRSFGVYLPLNYNSVTEFNAGLSLRAGPFFLGSGSILTSLMGKSKQADVHFGIRFGSLFKKEKNKKEEEVKPLEKEIEVIVEEVAKEAPKDMDGDGVVDEMDKCPGVAGLPRYNGCPIPDTDGDGINDEEDACASMAGLAKYKGCPIPDTDGDGINDEEDKCITLAGIAANRGCPEVKQEVVKKINYAAKSILFQTGKAVLLKPSFAQLDKVAELMTQDQDLQLSISGHTDNTGKPEKNLLLSESRASAVKDYLVKKGIAAERLLAQGWGDAQPVADNKTATGRAKNRRVELKLNY